MHDSSLSRSCPRAWRIERRERSVRTSQKSVTYVACIDVISRNQARVIDPRWKRTVEIAFGGIGARSVEHHDATVGFSQKAMVDIIRVQVIAGDCSKQIYAECISALQKSSARAGSVEASERAL